MTVPLQTSDAIAVVTGGAGGIGVAMAALLLTEGAGHVVLADMDPARIAKAVTDLAAGHGADRVSGIVLDVSDGRAVESAIADLRAAGREIDLWFSNAGISRGDGIGTGDDWTLSLGVNVMGHVHAARALMPVMAARGRGHFVVMASAAGLLVDVRSAAYSASKHAAVAFAEWLAVRYTDEGVGVSCICPEGVRTGMTRESSKNAATGMVFLEPEDLARHVHDALKEGRFLILPHPRVAEFERRRAEDRDRWIGGMRKARLRIQAAAGNPVSGRTT